MERRVRIGNKTFVTLASLMIFFISLAFMYDVDLSGDEIYYSTLSRKLYEYLIGNIESLDLVNAGWFPPGMAFLLVPLQFLFSGEVPLVAYRLYMLCINLLLILLIWNCLVRMFSLQRQLYLFWLMLVISPIYIMDLSVVWSEFVSVHLALLTLLLMIVIKNKNYELGTILVLGFVAFLITMMRGIYLAFPIFLGLCLFLKNPEIRRIGKFPFFKAIQSIILIFCVMLTCLLPWSLSVSEKYGARILLNGGEMSKIVWLGSKEYKRPVLKEFGGNQWSAVHKKIAAEAQKSGRSFRSQAQIELEKSVPEIIDPKLISKNISDFFALKDSSKFVSRFYDYKCKRNGKQVPRNSGICAPFFEKAIYQYNSIVWALIFGVGVALFIVPFRSKSNQFTFEFIFKGFVALVVVHPLIVFAHSRYYVQLIVLVALAVATVDFKSLRVTRDHFLNLSKFEILDLGNVVAVLYFLVVLTIFISGFNPLISR